jgi:hypothetical protein
VTGLRRSKPDFEFKRLSDGEILLGTIDRSVDLDQLETLLGKVVTLELRETRVRTTRPRYVLLGFTGAN